MKISKIYSYLYKTKIFYIFVSLLILISTVQIIDFIELAQANLNKENFSLNDIIIMSFLKMPFLINEILPFVIIISTSFYFKNLTYPIVLNSKSLSVDIDTIVDFKKAENALKKLSKNKL